MYSRAFVGRGPVGLVGEDLRVGHAAPPSGTPWPGLVPQVTNGVSCVGIKIDLGVEDGVGVGPQRPPVLDGGVPVRALRRVRPALAGKRRWSRPARSCPALAPHSMLMLQMVIRPSIESASMAEPRYSTM